MAPVVTNASASTGLNAVSAKDAEHQIEQEVQSFAEHIGNLLAERTHLRPKYLPLTSFFDSFRDGVLLGELIDVIKPGVIDVSKLKSIDLTRYEEAMKKKGSAAEVSPSVDTEMSKTMFEVTANLNLSINAAKKVGIVVVNIGANDFLDCKQDLVLGVVWQLIRYHLLSAINLNDHPELVRLLEPKETLSTLLSLPAESTLIRWFNYHLKRAGVQRTIRNFSKDIQDSELYIRLLPEVAPPKHKEDVKALADKAAEVSPETETGRLARAQLVLEAAQILGARKFVTAKDIVQGNAKLNLGFTATIFNREIGIHLPSEDDIRRQKAVEQSHLDRIEELERVVERKDNTIGQLGVMIRNKDERILDLNEQMREATISRLEEKDVMEKKLHAARTEYARKLEEAKAELASKAHELDAYKTKVAADVGSLRSLMLEQCPELVNETGDSTDALAVAIEGLLQGLRQRTAAIAEMEEKMKREKQMLDIMGTKIKEYAEQKAPNKMFGIGAKKGSQ
ncbi:calponin homology domain-containing protein [Hyaloraphidium curvatum]|nr:calponin homology domain-containing protein [Hyaloraphidium curvatum]